MLGRPIHILSKSSVRKALIAVTDRSVDPVIHIPQLYPILGWEAEEACRDKNCLLAGGVSWPLFSYLTWSEKIFWLSQPKGPWSEVIRSPSRSGSFRNKHIQTWDGSKNGAAYLGHADNQVPCGLRSFSKTAVRFDFCKGGRAEVAEYKQEVRTMVYIMRKFFKKLFCYIVKIHQC